METWEKVLKKNFKMTKDSNSFAFFQDEAFRHFLKNIETSLKTLKTTKER